MNARIASLWRPPDFDDAEAQRIAAVTLPLALTFAAASLFWLPVGFLVFGDPPYPLVAGTAAVGHGMAARLVQMRRPLAGAWLLLGTTFATTTAALVIGGVERPAGGFFIMSVFAAGLLIDIRAALAFASLSALVLLAVGGAETGGLLETEDRIWSPLQSALVDATVVVLSFALVWLAVRAIRAREARLAESEARFRAIAEHAPDLISEMESDGTLIYASPGWERVLGHPPQALQGLRPGDLVHSSDLERVTDLNQRVLAGDRDIPPIRLRHHDGSHRWFEFQASTFSDADGVTRIVSVGRDVTRHRDLQDQLQRAQRLDALGRMAGGVAHDFNNFLTVIMGAAESLAEELSKGHPLAERVSEIQEAANRSAALTSQLLAFGSRQPVQPRVFDLNQLLADTDRLLRRLLPADIVLESVRGDGLGRVRGDPGQLEQVVLNLAINARDAMPEGGTLTIETANVSLDGDDAIRGTRAETGRYVMLSVSDTGAGMDAETAARAFDPFFTTKPTGKGTGLGLSMVHGIVSQSGGHVEIRSEPEVGTTVEVYLPRVEEEVDAPDSGDLELAGLDGSERVLLVEDADLVRRHVRQLLTNAGYRVIEAADGREALALATADPGIDVVITDLVMPRMGGLELAQALRQQRPDLPVVFVSGYTENGLAGRGLERGAALVNKPFTPRELLRALRSALKRTAPGNGLG